MNIHKKRSHLLLAISILFFLGFNGCSGGGGNDAGLSTNACSQIGLQTRVINGAECSEQGSPIVQINLLLPGGQAGLCSGTLLTSTYVLTAAHCLFDNPLAVSVEVNGVLRNAKRFFSHPSVSVDLASQTVINDAALIELSAPFTSQSTLPILASHSVVVGDIISTFGYGEDENGTIEVLQSGEMKVSDITNNHIGAEFTGEGSNPCFGDSGGPAILSFQNGSGQDVDAIAGIVSSGRIPSCLEGDKTLFANTVSSSIMNFITSNVPGVAVE